MYSLTLSGRPTGAESYIDNITGIANGWYRTTRAQGGYWLGSFVLDSEQLTRAELTNFYENNIGCVIHEYTAGGMVSWEGIIQEMRLMTDGVERMISLRPNYWHNNVQVVYRSIVDGSRQTIAWSENTGASDQLGEMRFQVTLGATTSAAATAKQGSELANYAWPRSRIVSGVTFPRSKGRELDRVYVKCAGFWHTLNWLVQESNITDTATTIITTLIGNSEFVTAGRIETNALSTYVECSPNPLRLGDAIAGVVAQGDASFNLWQCGVYEDKRLVYEQAPQTVEYLLYPEWITDKLGAEIHPPTVRPGFLIYDTTTINSLQPAGSTLVWDDPQVLYVEQVEFVAPDMLRLRFYGEHAALTILGEQIRQETALPQPRV